MQRRSGIRRAFRGVTVIGVLTLVLGFGTHVADATGSGNPATAITYPATATATRYSGPAFDACSAPSLATMTAWTASPYRAVGVYVGGPNRSCAQPNLTAAWVTAVTAMGWKLVPIYMGRQAPCSTRTKSVKITQSKAATQGTASADDAIARMTALGMLPGSAVYFDLENYTPTDTTCRNTALLYLSAVTKQLHANGYLSGVYANLSSGAAHLAASYSSTRYARPDVLWVARWDGSAGLTGVKGVSDALWTNHQRVKQYIGDHDETYRGVTVNIDNDQLDAPVATVVHPYAIRVGTTSRRAPSGAGAAVAALSTGTAVPLVCQTPGPAVHGTKVWDKLADGSYVSDHNVTTGAGATYSPVVPRCYYPFQTTASDGLTKRIGPGPEYAKKGTLKDGALAWVVCQQKSTTSAVWDQLEGRSWVSDHYVANASQTSWTASVPRCSP